MTVTEDRRGAAEELARRWPMFTVTDFLETPFVLLGSVDEIVKQLIARRTRWGISYYVIFDPSIDASLPSSPDWPAAERDARHRGASRLLDSAGPAARDRARSARRPGYGPRARPEPAA